MPGVNRKQVLKSCYHVSLSLEEGAGDLEVDRSGEAMPRRHV
jgi:hypothetical protein